LISGNEQDVRSCLYHHQRNPHRRRSRAPPMTGFFGTDFWHAVEFSRNGRAPVEVFRPVAGQPVHAMSARPALSKTAAGPRGGSRGLSPGPSARASGSRGALRA